MTRTRFLGLAIGLLALTATASWDSKFFFVGRVATSAAVNNHLTLPFSLKGQYVKANCHDDAGVPAPLDTYVGVGKADGTIGLGTKGCADAGTFNCDLVRFSLGEKFYSQMLSTEDTVWTWGTDAGWCDIFVAGN